MQKLITVLILLTGHFTWAERHFQFAIIGDAGEWNSNTESVYHSIFASGVRDLILPGDNLYEPLASYDSVWGLWKKAGFNFPIVAIGNHTKTYAAEVQYFAMPGEYYSRTFSDYLKFLVLNSDNLYSVQEQAWWLNAELSRAKEKFLFVVYHHPARNLQKRSDWKKKKNFQKKILPILLKHREKITALIVGHDHIAGLYHFDQIPVIVSGATHDARKAKSLDEIQDRVHVQSTWVYDKTPHWVELLVSERKSTARFIRASDFHIGYSACLQTGQMAINACH